MSLGLFEGVGIEIEYMIADERTLGVAPIADALLGDEGEAHVAGITWSNELARHLVEFKTPEPVASLDGLASAFQASVAAANQRLAPHGALLMPGGMHPWMDPAREMQLWPHGYSGVYRALDRIFGCHGHGWANLQATHINLPFRGDDEFGRLHAAVRLLLPILPAIAAASPIMDGRLTGLMDTRLEVYRTNSARVPSVAGLVIPEPAYTQADYRRRILEPMWRDIAPLDPGGLLRYEWLNARGCIARFDRGSIEIRLIDAQECPAADIAVARIVFAVLRGLVAGEVPERLGGRDLGVEPLHSLLRACIRDADEAVLHDPRYLRALGLPARSHRPALVLWHELVGAYAAGAADSDAARIILNQGPLARRIVRAVADRSAAGVPAGVIPAETLRGIARELCACLAAGCMFAATDQTGPP